MTYKILKSWMSLFQKSNRHRSEKLRKENLELDLSYVSGSLS